MNTGSTNGLILLPSLSGQNGSLVRLYMYKVDLSSTWAYTPSLVPGSQPLQLLTSENTYPWGFSCTPVAGTDCSVHTHTAGQVIPGSGSCTFFPGDAQALLHPELALRDPCTPLLPAQFVYSLTGPAWSYLAITCLLANQHSLVAALQTGGLSDPWSGSSYTPICTHVHGINSGKC